MYYMRKRRFLHGAYDLFYKTVISRRLLYRSLTSAVREFDTLFFWYTHSVFLINYNFSHNFPCSKFHWLCFMSVFAIYESYSRSLFLTDLKGGCTSVCINVLFVRGTFNSSVAKVFRKIWSCLKGHFSKVMSCSPKQNILEKF